MKHKARRDSIRLDKVKKVRESYVRPVNESWSK